MTWMGSWNTPISTRQLPSLLNLEVTRYNAVAAAASDNENILHGTSTATDNKNEDNNIKEVDIPPNEPTELINVDVGSNGDHNQEQQDENPVDPNTTAMPDTTDINDRTDGDNPNGAVEM